MSHRGVEMSTADPQNIPINTVSHRAELRVHMKQLARLNLEGCGPRISRISRQ